MHLWLNLTKINNFSMLLQTLSKNKMKNQNIQQCKIFGGEEICKQNILHYSLLQLVLESQFGYNTIFPQ